MFSLLCFPLLKMRLPSPSNESSRSFARQRWKWSTGFMNSSESWTIQKTACSIPKQTVNFINGYYSVLLGADEENNPLDDSVFANYPLHLALKVDGENLEPRQPMSYAKRCVAESVDGGTVNASEITVGGRRDQR